MNKQKFKEVNIHEDYIAWKLITQMHDAISLVFHYMQQYCKYGENYKKMYAYYKNFAKHFEAKYEDLFARCLENKDNSQ